MPKKSSESGNSLSKEDYINLQQKLIENMVELQKVESNLAERFDKLSTQISSLLGLFETAAKSFASHPASPIAEKDKDFLDKIDKLLDQNKTIAKGLTLIEEKVRERMYGFGQQENYIPEEKESLPQPPINKPLPRF